MSAAKTAFVAGRGESASSASGAARDSAWLFYVGDEASSNFGTAALAGVDAGALAASTVLVS